ncbi:hypothetical protein [Photobacterium galatheae]|nr:hypothetical protein [Photobacterium galatheae]
MVHHFVSDEHDLSYDEIMKLKGYLSFSNSIEPRFIERLAKKYGIEEINKIKSFS